MRQEKREKVLKGAGAAEDKRKSQWEEQGRCQVRPLRRTRLNYAAAAR